MGKIADFIDFMDDELSDESPLAWYVLLLGGFFAIVVAIFLLIVIGAFCIAYPWFGIPTVTLLIFIIPTAILVNRFLRSQKEDNQW